MSELSEIAKKAASGVIPADEAPITPIPIETVTEETTSVTPEIPTAEPTAAADDDVVIIGKPKQHAPTQEETNPVNPTAPTPIPVDGVDLSQSAAIQPPSEKEIAIMQYNKTKPEEIKKLIMSGLTPEEAEAALNARLERTLAAIGEDSAGQTDGQAPVTTDDPAAGAESADTAAEIVIDKTTQDPNGLGLTQDEHDKLVNVRQVRLITVEDAELKTIEVEDVDTEHKADFIRGIEGTLSQYGVPLPILGDFIPFKGAQVIQLAQAIDYEDERAEDAINKKASLIYDKMMNGTVFKKYGPDGKIVMSYMEFINKFPYQDLDMAIYGILCASTMEESTASLTCAKCNHTWEQKYNVKTLMQTDGLSEAIMERYDSILAHKGDEIEIGKLHDESRKARRYKSPFTKNIYDVATPSVGRAIDVMKRVDQTDQVMVYNSALAMFLSCIHVYNNATGKYVPINQNGDETDLILQTVLTLPDEDTKLLLSVINDSLTYSPKFAIPSKCPSCKTDSKVSVEVSQLVFLRARDSFMEIQ